MVPGICVHVYQYHIISQRCLVVFFESDQFEEAALNFARQLLGKVLHTLANLIHGYT